MNEKITTRPDAPDASTPVVVKRFGDYDLALHLDGSVTWRDTGRVPVLPVAPAAEDLDPQAFEHTPEAAAFGAAIEQAAHDSGVGWDEVHPIELACRLMAAGYSLAARQPAPECRDCGRSDGGCDRDVEGAPVVSAEAAEDYAAGRWCGECRHGVVEDPPCCTPCPCCGGHSGEHQPAPVVSAEQVEAAWESAAYLVVDDPNGPEFGVVHLPFSQKDRMLRTLAALGIEAPRG